MSKSLERALTILELVAEEPRRIGEIADELNVHHSTALRLLHTLRDRQFVRSDAAHRYTLGSSMFRLGQQALEAVDIREIARPGMEELNAQTNETIHLAILEDDQVVYVEKVEAQHPVRMYSRIGKVAPLHCTGVAKAILAFFPSHQLDELVQRIDFHRFTPNTIGTAEAFRDELEEIRRQGWARDNEEHEIGIHCIAAPVWSADGTVVAGLSVSAPTSRLSWKELSSYVDSLVETTQAISAKLGWRPSAQPEAPS